MKERAAGSGGPAPGHSAAELGSGLTGGAADGGGGRL